MSYFKQPFFLLLIFVSFFYCFSCEKARKEWSHPLENHLPSDTLVSNRLDFSNHNPDYLPSLFDFNSIVDSYQINKNPDPENDFYVYPTKVDIDKENFIYILHEISNSIHVYNSFGELISKIGRGGRGPGEFLDIQTFTFSEDKEVLYVLDFMKVEIFKRKDGKFTYHDSIKLKFSRAFDMCNIGNALYVTGSILSDPEKTNDFKFFPISKIDLSSGKTLKQFGFEYKSVTNLPIYTTILSETLLDCSSHTQTIIAISRNFSYIFGYDTNGNKKWTSNIDSFLNREFIEFKDPKYQRPGLIPHSNEGLYHRKFRTRTIQAKEYSLLQVEHIKPQKWFGNPNMERPSSNYRTILLNSETGQMESSDGYSLILYKDSNTVITFEKADSDTSKFIFKFNKI
jgi:hypothetical protein